MGAQPSARLAMAGHQIPAARTTDIPLTGHRCRG